jgi:NitT/TauT family transport system ATP-binding protein
MKLSPGFLQQKKAILTRIRETAGMRTDYELLERMTRQAEQHLQ